MFLWVDASSLRVGRRTGDGCGWLPVKSRPQLMSVTNSPSGFVRIARLSFGGVSVISNKPVYAASS